MNKEEKLKISKMLREKDIDDKLEIYLSPDLYCYVHNYIVDLKMQIDRLTNNWNELEEWIMQDVKDEKPDLYFQVLRKIDILDKMKEIKENN